MSNFNPKHIINSKHKINNHIVQFNTRLTTEYENSKVVDEKVSQKNKIQKNTQKDNKKEENLDEYSYNKDVHEFYLSSKAITDFKNVFSTNIKFTSEKEIYLGIRSDEIYFFIQDSIDNFCCYVINANNVSTYHFNDDSKDNETIRFYSINGISFREAIDKLKSSASRINSIIMYFNKYTEGENNNLNIVFKTDNAYIVNRTNLNKHKKDDGNIDIPKIAKYITHLMTLEAKSKFIFNMDAGSFFSKKYSRYSLTVIAGENNTKRLKIKASSIVNINDIINVVDTAVKNAVTDKIGEEYVFELVSMNTTLSKSYTGKKGTLTEECFFLGDIMICKLKAKADKNSILNREIFFFFELKTSGEKESIQIDQVNTAPKEDAQAITKHKQQKIGDSISGARGKKNSPFGK
jgi:hypothetical protein